MVGYPKMGGVTPYFGDPPPPIECHSVPQTRGEMRRNHRLVRGGA